MYSSHPNSRCPLPNPLSILPLLGLLFTLGLTSCRRPDVPVSPKPAEVPATPVVPVTLQSAAKFPFGAAIAPALLVENAAYRATVTREYSSITSENVLKMENVHPAENRYDWSAPDQLVQFALDNGKRIHGHTLVWHEAVPAWATNFSGDAAAWENLFKTHIQTVVTHYRGRIGSWDVVNEAFEDDGSLRNSLWRQKLGDDYVARAFQYARQADPNLRLFYNDYGQESQPRKLQAMLTLVADFRRRGIPIDGLGLQMHLSRDSPNDGISAALRASAETGLLVHVSELDISMNPEKLATAQFTGAVAQAQADKYRLVAQQYNRLVPAPQRHGITTWNVGDGDSWIITWLKRNDWPLPFDRNYQKKPAYAGLLEGLK